MGIIVSAAEVAIELNERIHVLNVLPDSDESIVENVIIFMALYGLYLFHLFVFLKECWLPRIGCK